MKKLLVILGFITALLAIVLSVTPLFKLAYFPALAAVVFGLIALSLYRQNLWTHKNLQLVFLLTLIALSLSTYKSVFVKAEVGNTEELIQKENESEQDAIETLEDIDIDE